MAIAADFQAQSDRLARVAGGIDTYTANAVKAATDAMQADHDSEVAELKGQIDDLNTKLGITDPSTDPNAA